MKIAERNKVNERLDNLTLKNKDITKKHQRKRS